MRFIEQYLPNPTYVYFVGEDLVLEYRNLDDSTGVTLRSRKDTYECCHMAIDHTIKCWRPTERPVTLSAPEVQNWFEANYHD